MITREKLMDRHCKLIAYTKNEKSGYGSVPKAMFNNNGVFNENNWNGGDAVIRQFTTFLDDYVEAKLYASEFELKLSNEKGKDGEIVASFSWINDTNYIQIATRSYDWCVDKTSEWYFDQYLITYYKSRGATEVVSKNGQPITLDEYVELLNIIESSGFKFNMEI